MIPIPIISKFRWSCCSLVCSIENTTELRIKHVILALLELVCSPETHSTENLVVLSLRKLCFSGSPSLCVISGKFSLGVLMLLVQPAIKTFSMEKNGFPLVFHCSYRISVPHKGLGFVIQTWFKRFAILPFHQNCNFG